MSYYYEYYIGYKKDDKIFPLGPFSADNKLKCVVCKSRSFASNLHDMFSDVSEKMMSSELYNQFKYTDYKGDDACEVKWLPLAELPSGSFVKSGYFLIEDVQRYESLGEDDWDVGELFYERLTPTVYAAKAQQQHQFGRAAQGTDAEGFEVPVYNASDYMYYAYPDYNCKEYEAFLIRQVAHMLGEDMPADVEIVVLEREG